MVPHYRLGLLKNGLLGGMGEIGKGADLVEKLVSHKGEGEAEGEEEDNNNSNNSNNPLRSKEGGL